jgi:hypothetical protein
MKPPSRDTRALSPAGIFRGKAPLRLAAQKGRPRRRGSKFGCLGIITPRNEENLRLFKKNRVLAFYKFEKWLKPRKRAVLVEFSS